MFCRRLLSKNESKRAGARPVHDLGALFRYFHMNLRQNGAWKSAAVHGFASCFNPPRSSESDGGDPSCCVASTPQHGFGGCCENKRARTRRDGRLSLCLSREESCDFARCCACCRSGTPRPVLSICSMLPCPTANRAIGPGQRSALDELLSSVEIGDAQVQVLLLTPIRPGTLSLPECSDSPGLPA
jgi:hypothetical protein